MGETTKCKAQLTGGVLDMWRQVPKFCLAEAVAIAVLLSGCPSPPPTSVSGTAKETSVPPKVPGPPRAVIVVDVSASTMKYRKEIYQTVRMFLDEFNRDQEADLVFIRLDHAPEAVLQFNNARVSEAELKQFEAVFATTGPEGAGTDQVTAMELALDYARPTDRQPEDVLLLWFSDMIVDDPAGRRGAFRKWDSFDWSNLKEAGVSSSCFYFVNHQMAKALSAKAAAAGVKALFVEPQSMLSDLHHGRVMLP